MKTKNEDINKKEGVSEEIPAGYKKPFDTELNTQEEILFNCGKFGLPKEHVFSILRSKLSTVELKRLEAALQDTDSIENVWYTDGVAAGEIEIASSLHDSVVNADKDAYKSFSAENRRKAINKSIQKNFGIGDDNME